MIDIINQVIERWKGFPLWEDFIPNLSKFFATVQLTITWDFPRILYSPRISYLAFKYSLDVWLVLAALCPLIKLEKPIVFLSKQNWLVLLFQLFTFYFNPLNPKSDQHQISPCNINAVENRVKSWELSTWSGKMSVIDISTNSPNYFYWKSIGTVN